MAHERIKPTRPELALRDNSRFSDAVDNTLNYMFDTSSYVDAANEHVQTITDPANRVPLPTGGVPNGLVVINDDASSFITTDELPVFFDAGFHFERAAAYPSLEAAQADFENADAIVGNGNINTTFNIPAVRTVGEIGRDYQYYSWGIGGYGINDLRTRGSLGSLAQVPTLNSNLPNNFITFDFSFAVMRGNELADQNPATSEYSSTVFNDNRNRPDRAIRPFNDAQIVVNPTPIGLGSSSGPQSIDSAVLRDRTILSDNDYTLRLVFTAAPAPNVPSGEERGIRNVQQAYPFLSVEGRELLRLEPVGTMSWRPVFAIYTQVAPGERVRFEETPVNPADQDFVGFSQTLGDTDVFGGADPTLPPTGIPPTGIPPTGIPPTGTPNVPPPAPEAPVVPVAPVDPDTGRPTTGAPVIPAKPTAQQYYTPIDPIGKNSQDTAADWSRRYDGRVEDLSQIYGVDRSALERQIEFNYNRFVAFGEYTADNQNPVNNPVDFQPRPPSAPPTFLERIRDSIDFLPGLFGGGGNSGSQGGATGQASGASGDSGATGQQTATDSLTRYAVHWNGWQLLDATVTGITSTTGITSNTPELTGIYVVQLRYNSITRVSTLRVGSYPDAASRNYYDCVTEEGHPNFLSEQVLSPAAFTVFRQDIAFGNMDLLHIDEIVGSDRNREER